MGGVKFCTALRDLAQRQWVMRCVVRVRIPPTMHKQVVLHQIVLCESSLPFRFRELDEFVFQSDFQSLVANIGVSSLLPRSHA